MNSTRRQEPKIAGLAAEITELRERVEDLEDARDLEAAITANAGKPLIPWEQARRDLGLD